MTTLLLTETTLFFHDVISRTEKPSGLVKVSKWTAALAKQHEVVRRAAIEAPIRAAERHAAKEAKKHVADEERTAMQKTCVSRGCALTFGPGSKDWSSITTCPRSYAATPASISSSTTSASSTPTADVNSERRSEGKPAIARTFGGFHDETPDNFEDLVSVLGKWGSSMVCGLTCMAIYDFPLFSPLLGGSQNQRT